MCVCVYKLNSCVIIFLWSGLKNLALSFKWQMPESTWVHLLGISTASSQCWRWPLCRVCPGRPAGLQQPEWELGVSISKTNVEWLREVNALLAFFPVSHILAGSAQCSVTSGSISISTSHHHVMGLSMPAWPHRGHQAQEGGKKPLCLGELLVCNED